MLSADQTTMVVQQGHGSPLEQHLVSEWQRALGNDQHAQSQWLFNEGGEWTWQYEGVSVKSSGTEWAAFGWKTFAESTMRGLQNFVIQVTINGQATAAGLSFGPYKDFLARLDAQDSPRHLQLEVDVSSGCWAFRVDGELQHRSWWDAAIHSVDDLISGMLFFKAQHAKHVLFHALTIHTFHASCQLSVIMTCYRFLQRLRVSLRNWCHQALPSGAYEVLVINPGSPDGTHEYLGAVARSYPHVRVCEVAVGSKLGKNKGALINYAVKMSRGEWIWLTDADCLFAPTGAVTSLEQITGQGPHLFYGQRRYLTLSQTDALVVGRLDGLRDFDLLSQEASPRAPENEPWGYMQIVHRSTLERVPYREDHNHFAHSDMAFIEDCKRHRVPPKQVPGLFCLHMEHPFAWYGTDMFL
jgi:hypothetical protein